MSTLSYRQRGNWFVVGFNTDRLTDAAEIQSLQQSLFSALQRLPLRGNAVITFEGVEHASSQLVGLLLGAKRIVDDRFGKLVLCRVGPHLHKVLSITRLDSQFEIRERLRDVTGAAGSTGELVRAGPANNEPQWLH
jgi:anti-anti-sigma factor